MNALKVKGHNEFLWVRVLDLPRSFAARPWRADGEVVLDVTDAQGHAAGRWLVRTERRGRQVEATDREGDLALDAETLGSLYLAGVGIETAAPRRADHRPGRRGPAVRRDGGPRRTSRSTSSASDHRSRRTLAAWVG